MYQLALENGGILGKVTASVKRMAVVQDRLVAFGAFLLWLREASRNTSPASFRFDVLTRLQDHVGFSRAIWGDALIDGRMDLRKPEMFGFGPDAQPDAELGAFADPRLARVLGAPGVSHGYSLGENDPPQLRTLAAKHHIGHILSIARFDEPLGLASGIVFVRSGEREAFSEADRLFVDAAFDHVMQAWTDCQIGSLTGDMRWGRGETRLAAAAQGLAILAAESGFTELIRLEWPDWSGPELPVAAIATETGLPLSHFLGDKIVMRVSMHDDVALIAVRSRSRADSLSGQERRVAELCVAGLTYKEIATQLGIAATTARNHIAAVHRRLNVRRNSEIGPVLAEAAF